MKNTYKEGEGGGGEKFQGAVSSAGRIQILDYWSFIILYPPVLFMDAVY